MSAPDGDQWCNNEQQSTTVLHPWCQFNPVVCHWGAVKLSKLLVKCILISTVWKPLKLSPNFAKSKSFLSLNIKIENPTKGNPEKRPLLLQLTHLWSFSGANRRTGVHRTCNTYHLSLWFALLFHSLWIVGSRQGYNHLFISNVKMTGWW